MQGMTKAEQIAPLALARAPRLVGRAAVIIATNDQPATVKLLRSIEPRAVLSLIGIDAVRIHGSTWGQPQKDRPCPLPVSIIADRCFAGPR